MAEIKTNKKKFLKGAMTTIGVLLIGGVIYSVTQFSGPDSGQRFLGSTGEEHTLAQCDPFEGLVNSLPYLWWGIPDEGCLCDASKKWTQGPDVPNMSCGSENVACGRLEDHATPCVCFAGYEKQGDTCVLAGCPATALASKPGLIEVAAYDYAGVGAEQCACDASDNWVVDENLPRCGDKPCERLENVPDPCICAEGYERVGDDCIDEASAGATATFQSTAVDLSGASNFINLAGQEDEACPSQEMDENCFCPEASYYDPTNIECVDITCDLNKLRVQNSYNHNTTAYDHTSVSSRVMVEDYYREEDSYVVDCIDAPAAAQVAADAAAAQVAADAAAAQAAADAAAAQVAADAAAAQAAADAAAAQAAADAVDCDILVEDLSVAYYDENWTDYEDLMDTIDEEECFGYCDNNSYWSILYIAVGNLNFARDYYNDSYCEDCDMNLSLAGFVSEIISKSTTIGSDDEEILRDLIQNSLDYCPKPDDLQDFFDQVKFDEEDYFDQEATVYNRGFASLFPTAYAQSSPYSDGVEDIIADEYDVVYSDDADSGANAATQPECRSLSIFKPTESSLDQPIVRIPQTGFQNEELAIVVDADPGAVLLYRYKSVEGTITFDGLGNVYDTIRTSVLMNGGGNSTNEIVTVWALDDSEKGIQECHDSLYVQVDSPTAIIQPEELHAAADPIVTQPVTIPVIAEAQAQQQVVTPLPVQAPVSPYAYTGVPNQLHYAAVPYTPSNGPGLAILLIGSGLGGVLINRRKK